MKKESSNLSKKEKSFRESIREGSAYSAAQGIGNTLITPLAESIKASAIHIGLISALTGIISPLSQLYGNKLMENHSRKNIVKRFVITESFSWILISLIPVLFFFNTLTSILPWILIVFYSFIAISFGLTYPAFFSFLGDIIPQERRGEYIAKRDKYMIIASAISSIVGSLVIQSFKSFGIIFIGFALAFFLAFIFRIISFLFIEKMYFPSENFRLKKESETGFFAFLKSKDNYKKFAIAQGFLNFSLFIASPFFGLYLLRELGLKDNLVLFALISLSPAIFAALFSKISGKISDKYGNVILFYIAGAFFAISPLIWLVSSNIFWLILAPGIIAGIANSAYTIAVTNFTFDSVSRNKRGQYIAFANILSGTGVFVGSVIGGLLIDNVANWISGYNPYILVFFLAAIIRLIVVLLSFRKISEVRKTKKFPALINIHPLKAFNHELHSAGAFIYNLVHLPLTKFKNNK